MPLQLTIRLKSVAQRWLSRLVLAVMGIVVAALLVEGLLHLFPSLIPDGRAHSVDMGVVKFTVGEGDIFVARPGVIAPPTNPNDVLSEHRLAYDADGFRLPAKAYDHYDILALGDSYTEGPNVALPWPDTFAKDSGFAVRNMGFRGYGPVDEANVLKEYGPKTGAKMVIVGYFEGNDLYDGWMAKHGGTFILPNIARKAIAPFDPNATYWKTDKTGPFQFPVQVKLSSGIHEMAYLDTYLWWLNGTTSDFARSDNMAILGQSWQDMAQAMPSACLMIAYFPDAPHIYAPYVVPADQAKLLSTEQVVSNTHDGEALGTHNATLSFDQVVAQLNNQRDAVAALAASQHLPFIDLTPAFQAAATSGQVLYYTYDTHWNQDGQNLAGSVISQTIVEQGYDHKCLGK